MKKLVERPENKFNKLEREEGTLKRIKKRPIQDSAFNINAGNTSIV